VQTRPLRERIEAEAGLSLATRDDLYGLAGLFTKYRPDGTGLERLLLDTGVEGAVRARIQQVFAATAASWQPGDFYFVIRHYEPLSRADALKLAQDYLLDMKKLSDFVGDTETRDTVAGLKIEAEVPPDAAPDEDPGIMLYECLTDFLPRSTDGPDIFLLKEALYSMANDYSLLAYMLAPAIDLPGEVHGVLDSYFDFWRYGLKLEFYEGGIVTVRSPP
jgi:hypothetical protein